MADTDLNELKLNGMKNRYQHWKEYLYFSNFAKFQHITDMLKLCRVTRVKVLFLVLVYVFNCTLFSTFSLSRYVEIGHRQSRPVDECSEEERGGFG